MGDFQKAHQQLQETQELLELPRSGAPCCYGAVDKKELAGYLAACDSVLQTGAGKGGVAYSKEPAAALEYHFKKQEFKASYLVYT